MRIDLYTKTVLTVIALCLVYLCSMQSGVLVHAQSAPATMIAPLPAQPVVIVGYGHLDASVPGGVEIAWADRQRRVGDEALPVRPVDDPRARPLRVDVERAPQLSVSVDAIRRGGQWDAIRTDVEKQPAQGKPGGGD
ncbi:MAG: hypothetical protein ACRD1V_21315 [Vicinamibacterales bacterium]